MHLKMEATGLGSMTGCGKGHYRVAEMPAAVPQSNVLRLRRG
jgi:hypothetical protein